MCTTFATGWGLICAVFSALLSVSLASLTLQVDSDSGVDDSLRAALRHTPGGSKLCHIDIVCRQGKPLTVAFSDMQNHVTVLRNYGKTWRAVKLDAKFDSPARVKLHDFDKDGQLELVVSSDRVAVYAIGEHSLDLLWTSESLFSSKPAPNIGVGDCNGDGIKDLVLVNYKNKNEQPKQESLYLFAGQATPQLSFELVGKLSVFDRHGFSSTSGVAVADFVPNDRDESLSVMTTATYG